MGKWVIVRQNSGTAPKWWFALWFPCKPSRNGFPPKTHAQMDPGRSWPSEEATADAGQAHRPDEEPRKGAGAVSSASQLHSRDFSILASFFTYFLSFFLSFFLSLIAQPVEGISSVVSRYEWNPTTSIRGHPGSDVQRSFSPGVVIGSHAAEPRLKCPVESWLEATFVRGSVILASLPRLSLKCKHQLDQTMPEKGGVNLPMKWGDRQYTGQEAQ